MNEYTVSLEINIAANSPEEAVQEFKKWIREEGLDAWVYGVQDLDSGTAETVDSAAWS